MNLKEVAKILRVTRLTVKRKIKNGELKAKIVNPHHRWEITAESLINYLASFNE